MSNDDEASQVREADPDEEPSAEDSPEKRARIPRFGPGRYRLGWEAWR